MLGFFLPAVQPMFCVEISLPGTSREKRTTNLPILGGLTRKLRGSTITMGRRTTDKSWDDPPSSSLSFYGICIRTFCQESVDVFFQTRPYKLTPTPRCVFRRIQKYLQLVFFGVFGYYYILKIWINMDESSLLVTSNCA